MQLNFVKFTLLIVGVFIGTINSKAQMLLPMGSTWKYLDNGTDQGSTWKDVGFNDASWFAGAGELGYGVGSVATIVGFGSDANNKYITTYFRTQFNIADINQIGNYMKMVLKRDDGAVIYINGVEVLRSNMPATAVTFTTLAASNNQATETRLIPKTAFVQGNNEIAVSIHQTNVTSSDIWFDMSIENVQEQFVIGSGRSWKYLDNGSDQGTAWTSNVYDDNSWQSSLAPLGYVMTGVLSTVSYGSDANNKYRTTYYRKTVNVSASDLSEYDSLLVTLRIDDGAILYINGNEVVRRNMPTGIITYTTLASSPAVGSAPAVFTSMLPMSLLTTGNNVFAVEIHQQAANSSDTYFDMSVDPVKNDSVIVNSGGSWKYNDQGTSSPAGWADVTYDDAAWSAGNAVLGYGNGDESTVVSYGANAANKHTTAYFRKKFNLLSTAGYANLRLNLKRDDGAVIYVNGVDVYRNNMMAGAVSYSTTAISPIEGADENAWLTINLPPSLLVSGDNVIAVEIHKYNNTETDLRFDLKASLQQTASAQTPATPIITCNPSQSNVIGCFTSVKPSAQTPGFVIPATHTFQLISKTGMTGFYTNSGSNVPNNPDFTGYIGTAGSSSKGIISINHEITPGAVSLVSLHFNDTTKLWAKDSARLADFTTVVATGNNCSGGITPWGTVVTSEEATNTADVNADTYHDRGWQVEINPVSGQVVNQDGIGGPDKIWAMGKMAHENICIKADSTVAYQGEDGGTSCIYKFVMAVKGKLNQGTLYVLKRDAPTSTTGTWVVVPNSTAAQCNSVSSAAGALGGTNWGAPEDIEFGPDGKMYFTTKTAGNIWRFKDDGTTVSEIEQWVQNVNYPITHGEGTTNESFSTGIDNLTFDSEGNLWALQDGSRGHLWVIRPDHTPAVPHVELFAVTPAGSESTGLTFTPDFKFGFVSFQHPTAGNSTVVVDAAGNNVVFNNGMTIVFARKENLGAGAVQPIFSLGNNITTCGSTILTANTSPGVLNVWQDNSTNNTLTVSSTGWYKATAYANNGQSYIDSVYVTINPIPAAPVSMNQSACAGSTIPDLTGSGTNINWYSDAALTTHVGTGNTFATGQTAVGTYTYYATQTALGCEGTYSSSILTINTLPAAPISSNQTTCANTTIPDLSASGTNINWYSDAGLTTLEGSGNNLSTGLTVVGNYTYYATQADINGCVSPSSTAVLTINALPAAPTANNQSICFGSTVPDLVATGTNINWYSDAALTILSASGNIFATGQTTAGTYTYYATQTDGNGCVSGSSTAVLVINSLPAAPTTNNQSVCLGSTVPDLTASGTNIIWYNDAGLTTQVGAGSIYTSGQTALGTYTFYATQTDVNACTSTGSFATLTIHSLPVVALGTDITQCGGNVLLDAGNQGSTYAWSTSGTTQTINTASSNTYSVVVTDGNNCSNSDAIDVTINPVPVVALGSDITQCGGNVVLDAGNAGSTYSWSTSGTTQTINAALSNTYSVVVTDANNCTGSDEIIVTINSLPVTTTSLNGLTITADQSGAAYAWLDCDNGNSVISGANSQSYTVIANGNYGVVVSMNGCSDTSACVNINAVGVQEVTNTNDFVVYPNPNSGMFTIQSANEGRYSIVNELGQTVQLIELNASNKYAVTIENIATGIYFIVGYNNNQIVKQKVVVTK